MREKVFKEIVANPDLSIEEISFRLGVEKSTVKRIILELLESQNTRLN